MCQHTCHRIQCKAYAQRLYAMDRSLLLSLVHCAANEQRCLPRQALRACSSSPRSHVEVQGTQKRIAALPVLLIQMVELQQAPCTASFVCLGRLRGDFEQALRRLQNSAASPRVELPPSRLLTCSFIAVRSQIRCSVCALFFCFTSQPLVTPQRQ